MEFLYTCPFHDDFEPLIFPRLPIELRLIRVFSRTHLRFVAFFACGSQRRCRFPPSPASRRNGSRRLYASSDRRRISVHRGKVVIRPGARQFSPVTWLKQSRWQQRFIRRSIVPFICLPPRPFFPSFFVIHLIYLFYIFIYRISSTCLLQQTFITRY